MGATAHGEGGDVDFLGPRFFEEDVGRGEGGGFFVVGFVVVFVGVDHSFFKF